MGGEEWQEWIVLALLSWLYLIYQLKRDIFENPHSKTGELFARVFMQMQNVELTHGGGI